MLDLDKLVKATEVHSIRWKGKIYTARALSLAQFAKIQALYNVDIPEKADAEQAVKPLRSLLISVGYPADELINELPLDTLAKVQEELLAGLTGQATEGNKKKEESGN